MNRLPLGPDVAKLKFNACLIRRGGRATPSRELRAGGVARFRGNIAEERATVLEAVDTAGLLRREEYVARGMPVGGHAV